MACGSCVDKLARKLLLHHPKLDFIRAYELAEKGVDRYEANKPILKPQSPQLPRALTVEEKKELEKQGIDPDYWLNCTGATAISACGSPPGCPCVCPHGSCGCPSPIAYSHLVLNSCTYGDCTCVQSGVRCLRDVNNCWCGGSCAYVCDTGYHLDGVSCVPDVVASPLMRLLKGVGL